MAIKFFIKAIFFLLFLFLFVLILPFERMSVSSYFVIIFFTLLFILSLFLTRDLASPQVILCLTWSISLFLTSLDITFVNRVSHFNEMLSIQTWILIYISILCFFIGSTITMYPTRSGLRQKIGKNKLNWNSKLLDFIIYISFGIAFLVYLFAVIRNGGVPAFSDNISNARSDFIPGTLGIFLTLFQLVPMITIFKVVKSGFKSNKLPIFLSLISIICSLLTTQRIAAVETILMSGILFLVLWPYTSEEIKKIRRKTFLYVGVIFSILFIWSFILIGQIRGLGALQMTDLDNVIIEQLYIYFGGPAPRNFQMILEGGIFYHSNEPTNGALFFRPFLWFAGFRDEVSLDGTFKGPNNGTALMNYYIDIGVLGLLLFPLFWGAVTGFFYGYFRRSLTLFSGVIYALLANAIYFLPLSERFSEPSTFIKLILFSLVIISITSITKTKIKIG